MDYGTIFGALPTEIAGVISDVVPLGVTVLVALAGINIAIKLFRKFGVRGN